MTSRISIKDFDLPREHLEIIRSIHELVSRRSIECYLVGGYIRDLLLGMRPTDLDFAVTEKYCKQVADFISVEVSLSKPVCFKRFKTFHLAGKEVDVQVSPLLGSLKEDSWRRDFTINCLYIDIKDPIKGSKPILDPTGRGLHDLKARVLRTPADPEFTFWSDPLRIVRAIRFFAILGMRIEKPLTHTIERMAYLVSGVSKERVRVEIEKILLSNRVRSAFRLLHRTRLLSLILPEIDRMHGFDQRCFYHPYDLFEHSLRVVEALPMSLELRLAGLFHDVGKIDTCQRLEDRNTYYGHEKVSARIALSALSRLRFSKKTIDEVVFLIENHMVNYDSSWSDKAVRRFIRKTQGRMDSLLALLEADRRSHRAGIGNIRELRRRIRYLNEYVERSRIDILDGKEIMKILGIPPGPLVGEAKRYLLEVSDTRGKITSKEEASDILKTWFDRISAKSQEGKKPLEARRRC